MANNENWEELLGSKDWEGLLTPLDDSLRQFILRCGDLAGSANDALNDDPTHPYCGGSQFGLRDLLAKTFVPFAADYIVTHLLYARSNLWAVPTRRIIYARSDPWADPTSRIIWSEVSNFMGYVAVSSEDYLHATGHREIVVAWRGTRTGNEWVNNMFSWGQSRVQLHGQPKAGLAKNATGYLWHAEDPMVATAWMITYTVPDAHSNKPSAQDQLRSQIQELVQRHQDEKSKLSITFVGHSLGGALAILSAFDIVEHGLSRNLPVCAVVFGCPKIGNKAFFDRIKENLPTLKILSVNNKGDWVPALPPDTPDSWWFQPPWLSSYVDNTAHAVLQVDLNKSPYLRSLNSLDLSKLPEQHDLQSLLHTVAGWNGEDKEFKVKEKLKRSLALVNKHYSMLVPEEAERVPGKWFQVENKGMVMDKDGNWELPERA